MAKARANTGSGNGQNIIPIIFTIGVIGWGFFAIDRLTGTETPDDQVRAARKATEPSGFKAWLLRQLTPAENQTSFNNTGKVKDRIETPSETVLSESPERKVAKLPFYRLNQEGLPEIALLERSYETETSLIEAIIRGPDLPERKSDYIDAFESKPEVLSAKKSGDTLVVDVDRDFTISGHDVARYQIFQLLKAAQSLEGVRYLKLMVKGKPLRNSSGDGMRIPEVISDSNWSVSSE